MVGSVVVLGSVEVMVGSVVVRLPSGEEAHAVVVGDLVALV